VYVDDIVLAYSHDEIHEEFKHKFCKRFAARYEGPLKWFLGMAIDQDEKTFAIQLDHQLNIDRMVEKFIPHNSVTRECGSSACLSGARVPARRVLLSLAGSHSRSPPPLAGLADGTNLLCHYKRDRVPAAVGRGRSAAVRVTILGR
jgi:hypothetical protein